MPHPLQHSASVAPTDPLDARPDMSGEDDDQEWSLPWPGGRAQADDPPSRPPKVWGAEPNLGRIWPVQTRPGGLTVH